jgi:hypothetical protein
VVLACPTKCALSKGGASASRCRCWEWLRSSMALADQLGVSSRPGGGRITRLVTPGDLRSPGTPSVEKLSQMRVPRLSHPATRPGVKEKPGVLLIAVQKHLWVRDRFNLRANRI